MRHHKEMKNRHPFGAVLLAWALAWGMVFSPTATVMAQTCDSNSNNTPAGAFNPADYTLTNSEVNASGNLSINMAQAYNSNNDVGKVPVTQEMLISFIAEQKPSFTGYPAVLGWFYKNDAYDNGDPATGTIQLPYDPMPGVPTTGSHPKLHYIFFRAADRQEDPDNTVFGSDDSIRNNHGDGVIDTIYDTDADYDGDGVWFDLLYAGPTSGLTEAMLEGYGFVTNGDGIVDNRDMKRKIGPFKAGEEIVFFYQIDRLSSYYYVTLDELEQFVRTWIYPNHRFYSFTTISPIAGVWAPDPRIYEAATFPTVTFNFDQARPFEPYDCITHGMSGKWTCYHGDPDGDAIVPAYTNGWLTQFQLDRLATMHNLTPNGILSEPRTRGEIFSYILLGGDPANTEKQVMGVEFYPGGGGQIKQVDLDIDDNNDDVFLIEKPTIGSAELTTAIGPLLANSNITMVTLATQDFVPSAGVCENSSRIDYSISIDDGATWIPIRDWEWGIVKTPDNNAASPDVDDWRPGAPEDTYRLATLDMRDYNAYGRQLKWKIDMRSSRTDCLPEVKALKVDYTATDNSTEASRAAPTLLASIMYEGRYQLPPDTGWNEIETRGNLYSRQVYDPVTLTPDAGKTDSWPGGAGAIMTLVGDRSGTIFTPQLSHVNQAETLVAPGSVDGIKTTFTATIANRPIQFSSVEITDGVETFRDAGPDQLVGDRGGYGTIDRESGAVSVTFNQAPVTATAIMATYSSITGRPASPTTGTLTPTQWTAALTNATYASLDDAEYYYWAAAGEMHDWLDDFNQDGLNPTLFGADDWNVLREDASGRRYDVGAGNFVNKQWKMAALDHSVPAVVGTPGLPVWYFGHSTTTNERNKFDEYRCGEYFKNAGKGRRTIAYVGDRLGQLHGFDAGQFTPYIVDAAIYTGGAGGCSDVVTFKESINASNKDANGSPLHPDWGTRISRGFYAAKTAGGTNPDYGTGDEVFAFTPSSQPPRLKNRYAARPDNTSVDTSPSVQHVFDGTNFKAILVSAMGSGGGQLFGLDISSESQQPGVMWEYHDPHLFDVEHAPPIGMIGNAGFGSRKGTWVVAANGNHNPSDTEVGKVFILNALTGAEVSVVNLDVPGETPSGSPDFIDADRNGYFDRLYLTTDEGNIYKVNLPNDPLSTGTVPSTACLIYSAGQPIHASPVTVALSRVDASGEYTTEVMILVGTGDDPDLQEGKTGETYRFLGVLDTDSNGGCGSASLKWSMDLPAGHRVFASAVATVLDNAPTVYFGTSAADTADPCAPNSPDATGDGNIYALNVTTGQEIASVIGAGNITTTPVVDDEHLYIRGKDGAVKSFGGNTYQNDQRRGGSSVAKQKNWREIIQ